MYFRVLLLLFSVVAAESDLTWTNQKSDLVRTVINLYTVICDLFNIFFRKEASFRYLLSLASELVSAWLPQPPIPSVPERWWGDDHATPDNTFRTFKLHFSDRMISDLRFRIRNRRNITASLSGAGRSYGTNSDQLERFLDHWAYEYDFKKREDWLNSYPQYITNIQGLDIHFIHVRPPNPHGKKVVPLLLLHGWPTTAYDFHYMMKYLLVDRQDSNFVFEMVSPHFPGFGYSQATNKIGIGMANYQTGIILKNLMARLGLPRFYLHAGGLGQMVADTMAVLFPDKVLGLHTDFAYSIRPQTLVKLLLGQFYPRAVVEARYENRLYPLSEKAKFFIEVIGYFHMYATRPDNVGPGLVDSPVAQAAWFNPAYETYDPEYWFDIFTVYWDSECMTTSMREYAESMAFFQDPLTRVLAWSPTSVPVASTHFLEALIYQPPDFIRDKYPNLLQVTMLDIGGHFGALRDPGPMADVIRSAVEKMERFHANQKIQPVD